MLALPVITLSTLRQTCEEFNLCDCQQTKFGKIPECAHLVNLKTAVELVEKYPWYKSQ